MMRSQRSWQPTGGNRPCPTHRRGRLAAPIAILLASLTVARLAGIQRVALQGSTGVAYADEDDEEAGNLVQAPSRVHIVNGRTELVLSRAAVENAGIALAHPAPSPAAASLQGYGEVVDAATLTALESRYRTAAAQATAAQARAGASRAALARARLLYRDRQNMSAAQLQSARSAYQADEASLDAAQSGLSALAATIAQNWGPVLVKAVTEDSGLLRNLVSRRDYLITATLPSGVVPASAPTHARARLPGGASIPLTLVSQGTTVNPLMQGLRYYYSAPASAGLLAGLHLEVDIPIPAGARTGLIVPESAVVWLQGEPWIYRLTAAARPQAPRRGTGHRPASAPRDHADREIFVRERIAPESQTGDGGYVVSRLTPDTQIVVRGAQLLLSEEFRAQVERQGND